jgi:hypothetical protein
MSTTVEKRMPLVDHEFRFRLPSPVWTGCDEEWVEKMTLQSRDWLYSLPHVIGSVPYKEELFACLWRDPDRSQGVDIVYLIIATEAYVDAHRDDRKGAIAVTLSVGAGKSCYQVAEKLESAEFLHDLQEVLDIVLAQGRLRVI